MTLLLALAILLWSEPAHAGFLVPFLLPTLTGFALAATQFVVNLAVGFGLSYVASKLLQQKPQNPVGGTQLDARADADIPMSLIVGRAVTAGSFVYAGTYGKRGSTDNSDLIEIRSLADHRCHGLVKVFVEGEERELLATEGARGQPVDGYDGKLAVKFFDGSQVSADTFTVGALGLADDPWTTEMVGTDISYVRTHSIYDTEKVPGQMRWKFVVDGIHLYDPRKDTSVGGSGSHRFDQLDTHEFSTNLAVIAYNILRGIYVHNAAGNRVFFYGLEGTQAAQLPLDIWFAAMNECDVPTAIPDTSPAQMEPQFTAGGEITLDTEPLEVIKALVASCGGRFVEIGGIYKLYIGSPGLPVLTFSDDSIAADREEPFKPILPLEQRINYLTGTYTSPEDGWVPKVAPVRENTDWQALDGQRCPSDLNAPMIQSGSQMQRVMQQMLNRSRRERKHVVPLPPIAIVAEPGDIVAWNSDRNGYINKLFEVEGVEYESSLFNQLSITETDPADYDWESDDALPETPVPVISRRPEPKVVGGFAASPFLYIGDLGTKRPAIRLTWDDPEDGDATGVAYQVRVATDIDNVAARSVTGSDVVSSGGLLILDGLQSITNYQVRARFISENGYASDWSLWLNVTTPDARITPVDFAEELRHLLLQYQNEIAASIRRNNEAIAALVAEIDSNTQLDKADLKRDLVRSAGQVTASYLEAITVAVGPDSAIAQQLTQLSAAVNNVSANLAARFIVGVTPEGALAAYELEATAQEARAGFRIVAYDDGMGGAYSEVMIDADRFYIGKQGVADFVPIFIVDTSGTADAGTGDGPTARILINGNLVAPGTIDASKLNVGTLTAITAALGDATVTGKLSDPSGKLVIDFTNGNIKGYA